MKNRKELTQPFADNLLKLRLQKEMSLRDLERATGISRTQLHKYENNTADPSMTNVVTLAKFFGVTVDWFVGESKTRNIGKRGQTDESA